MGDCMASSRASALIWCYCNSPRVSVVRSLSGAGLNGKHVEKLAVLLEGRKINREERETPLLSVRPSIIDAVPGKVQIRHSAQAGVLLAYKHIADSPPLPPHPPPPAPRAHIPGLVLWGSEVRIIIIGCTWGRRRERKAETEDRTADSPEFRFPPPKPPHPTRTDTPARASPWLLFWNYRWFKSSHQEWEEDSLDMSLCGIQTWFHLNMIMIFFCFFVIICSTCSICYTFRMQVKPS